jgi:hypothetical protein
MSSIPITSALMVGVRPSSGPLVPVIGDGTAHLAYELYLSNFARKPVRIDSLAIRGVGGAPFESILGQDELKSSFIRAGGARQPPQDPVLPPGTGGVIFVFLNFATQQAPARLSSTMVVEADGDSKSAQTIPLDELEIEKTRAAAMDSPLAGDHWEAANGPSNTSLHRRAIIVMNGQPRVPERYAIDWIKLGDDGNSFTGDEHKNTSYHCYDVPVTAAADGRVVSVVDGMPENVPHSDKMAVEMRADNLAGNDVVEDIGGGRYVGYAHLRPGTVAVKAGDQVRSGQLLGKLGNTGNSTEPHLHLQICNGPSFLICEGLPMEFKQMSVTKYKIDRRGETPIRLVPAETKAVADQEPMEDELVTFRLPALLQNETAK